MTETATATVTESAPPRPTRTTTETATATVTATPTPTEAPETASGAASETLAPSPSESPSDGTAGSDSGGVPSWVWWLLAALAIAAVAVPLLVRSSRRRTWQAELAAAEEEVAWFARTLVPDLRAARTAEAIRGGWSVSEERVAGTEDRLTALVASAPDDQGRGRAVTLRDGVRDARTRIRALSTSGSADATLELDQVVVGLEAALAAGTPTGDAPPA